MMQVDRIVQPARLPQPLFAAAGYFLPRLLFLPSRHAAQISWGDIAVALQDFPATCLDLASAEFWHEWMERWSQLGETYARDADTAPSTATACRRNRAAAACFHWAEFMYFADDKLKHRLRTRIRERFRRSIDPRALAITEGAMTWRDATIPYYLLWPQTVKPSSPVPCMILSNGLDSATEVEMVALAEPLLERGIAALLFDGPGQGINLGCQPLPVRPEEMIEPLIAELQTISGIDCDRLGFLGISFGGAIALRAAVAYGAHLRCVVNLSGGPELRAFEALPRRLKQDFAYAFGVDDPAKMQSRFDALAIGSDAMHGTDVLSFHGALDDIFPVAPLRALHARWGSRHALKVYETEAHACLNYIGQYTQESADWTVARLR
jgi:pimeloyl-ACP methyl ester carboxylesterase